MNGLIALSLSLVLGQTAPANTGEVSSSPSLTLEEAERAVQRREVEELRAQMQLLQAQLSAQETDAQERLETLEAQQSSQQAAAQRLEQLRVQRLDSLERGFQELLGASRLLESGESTIGPALLSAQDALVTALASASESGHGETAAFIQGALNQLSTVSNAVDQRDYYQARMRLQDAGEALRGAWQLSQNRSGASLVTP